MGFRTEQLYGESFRDAQSIMAHEVFHLQNTDILDTLSETILKNTEIGKQLKCLSNNLTGNDSNSEICTFLDKAFEDETIANAYFKPVLEEINRITGKNIQYALWLCDSAIDVIENYECMDDEQFTEFDEYEDSDISLADLGAAGKLYGYEHEPKHIRAYIREIDDLDYDY